MPKKLSPIPTAEENKKNLVDFYFNVGNNCRHLLVYENRLGQNLIGYAGVWNGWLPLEQEQVEPRIELLCISPKYNSRSKEIIEEINKLLPDLKAE